MQNEIEKLMRPRFEVIAPYPNCTHKVSDIIEGIHAETLAEHYRQYPHLFRELKWWEKRTEDEMPKFVKSKDGDVCKVRYWLLNGSVAYKAEDNFSIWFISDELPATEAEYKGEGKL